MPYPPLEPTHEQRLRRWARENYTPVVGRSTDWHPVILDEMAARDRAFAAQTDERSPRTDGRRLDRSHDLRAANFVRRAAASYSMLTR